ncbi:hypothetical protein CRENBAI_003606 [Crenichthys baileyi]|uniref:Uncharacterized protein n=1 Tax=Crenichthys baileyi TaxID=28760 RepID=A0AAV9SMX5_9TELE
MISGQNKEDRRWDLDGRMCRIIAGVLRNGMQRDLSRSSRLSKPSVKILKPESTFKARVATWMFYTNPNLKMQNPTWLPSVY